MGRLEVGSHHGEGLVLPVLPGAESARGSIVGGGDRQVVAAEALDRQHRARCEQVGSCRDRLAVQIVPLLVDEAQPRPAGRAAHGLGMEAPVRGIVILAVTGIAHRESGHGRPGPVVRDVEHDGEAGPAVRAVHERVAEASIPSIPELAEAVVAGGDVGRDEGSLGCGRAALHDREARGSSRRDGSRAHPLDDREGRCLGGECRLELRQPLDRSLDLDEDPFAVVADETGQVQLMGESVDVGAEPDALHDAVDAEPPAFATSGRHHHKYCLTAGWRSTRSRGRVEGFAEHSGEGAG